MRIDVHIHTDSGETTHSLLTQMLKGIARLQLGQEKIMATQAEVAQALTDLGTQLDKVQAEIVAEVAALEAAIAAAGNSTPEVDAALASLKAKVQTLDDLNPDAPPAP